jgi:hypothetical protein
MREHHHKIQLAYPLPAEKAGVEWEANVAKQVQPVLMGVIGVGLEITTLGPARSKGRPLFCPQTWLTCNHCPALSALYRVLDQGEVR